MAKNGDDPTYFMVRIWGESELEFANPTKLRGHITHIPSHRRCYFEDLQEILEFIEPYLDKMGIEHATE